MSAKAPPPPSRSQGFYENWTVFGTQAIVARIRTRSGKETREQGVAALLLASGAVLGAAGLTTIVQACKGEIDKLGQEWGISNLSTWLTGAAALVGAVLGGVGLSAFSSVLRQRAKENDVQQWEKRLLQARREFTELLHAKKSGRISDALHRRAVDALFSRLTQQER